MKPLPPIDWSGLDRVALNRDYKFKTWMDKVNSCFDHLGITADDLPDVCYRDWFDAGVSPATAAKRAMRNAME